MKWIQGKIFSLLPLAVLGFGSPLIHRDAALCEDLEYIIGDYATLKGSLQGASIVIPGLSRTEAGTATRQFLSFIDPAYLNVYGLWESLASCKKAGAVEEKPPSAAICTAVTSAAADVAKTVTLMSNLTKAKDIPKEMDIASLQDVVDDAKTRIVRVTASLGALGCNI